MKKLLIAFSVAALAGSFATADYMRWMVDSSSLSDASVIEGGGSGVDLATYAYAQLVQSSESSHGGDYEKQSLGNGLTTYVGDYEGTVQKLGASVFADGSTIAVSDIGDSTQYFYIELFDSAGTLMGYSSALSATELSSFTSTSRFAADWGTANAWGGGSYTAVPEPTSGLMLLVGAAMLGLRRKKIA